MNTHGRNRHPTACFIHSPGRICELGGLRAVMPAILTVTCLCILSVSVCCAVSTSSIYFDCLPSPVCVSLFFVRSFVVVCARLAPGLSALSQSSTRPREARLALGSLRVSSMPPPPPIAITLLE